MLPANQYARRIATRSTIGKSGQPDYICVYQERSVNKRIPMKQKNAPSAASMYRLALVYNTTIGRVEKEIA